MYELSDQNLSFKSIVFAHVTSRDYRWHVYYGQPVSAREHSRRTPRRSPPPSFNVYQPIYEQHGHGTAQLRPKTFTLNQYTTQVLFKQGWEGCLLPVPYPEAGTMGTIDNPPEVFHPQQTNPSTIDASSPPVDILYDGLRVADISMAKSISGIRSFMHSSSRIAAARNLRGEEAQGLIDLIDRVSGTQFQHD